MNECALYPPCVPYLLIALVGVLGGYTTFSSFTFETFELIREGRVGGAIFNSIAQVVIAIAAFWAAWAIARTLAVVRS